MLLSDQWNHTNYFNVHDSSESLFSLFGTYHCIAFMLDNSKNPYPGLLVFNECESNSENLDLKNKNES